MRERSRQRAEDVGAHQVVGRDLAGIALDEAECRGVVSVSRRTSSEKSARSSDVGRRTPRRPSTLSTVLQALVDVARAQQLVGRASLELERVRRIRVARRFHVRARGMLALARAGVGVRELDA